MKKQLWGIILLAMVMMLPSFALARDELKNTDPQRYYIYLDTGSQVVTVYEKDDNCEYTRIVRRMICTSGRTQIDPLIPDDKGTPTPSGTWHIGARERFGKFASFQNEYARYWTQIVDGVYFHSVMFGARDLDKLKRSAYAHLGLDGSHGCVRLLVEDAKWLYYHACPGTKITVGGRSQGVSAEDVKPDTGFKEYDRFQKSIYDEEENVNLTAWVVAEEATLRTGNGSNDSVISRLKIGDAIEVLQEGDPWIKARVDGKEGYVKRAYVSYERDKTESVPDGLYLKTTVYLYSEPSTRAERICKVPHDTSLILLDQSGVPEGWTLVQYWMDKGYVQSRSIAKGWATLYPQHSMPVSIKRDLLGE